MKYKIGEVAKLLGMTTEGIRFYEDMGIINPNKDKNTNIRYYDVWDIHMLIRARTYRQIGFSLPQVSDIINDYENTDLSSLLSDKEREIEDEIIMHMNTLKYIRKIKAMTEDAKKSIGQYTLDYNPGIYRLEMETAHQLITSQPYENLINQWVKKAPFIFTSALFPKEAIETKGSQFTIGLAIEEEFADYLRVKADDDVKYFPSRLCIHTVIESSSKTKLSPAMLSDAFEYIKSRGLELADAAFSRIVLIHKADTIYSNLHHVWLPVK